MKKYILASALAVLTLTACKKNEKADQLTVTEQQQTDASQQQLPPSPVTNQEDLLKATKSTPVTNLALSQSHYDFGKIKKGDKVDHTYEVTNTGSNPLIISSVVPGCGCTAPEYTKEPILPGKTGKITLSFDSTNFDGLVNKQAEVYANIEKAPITITFSANIQP